MVNIINNQFLRRNLNIMFIINTFKVQHCEINNNKNITINIINIHISENVACLQYNNNNIITYFKLQKFYKQKLFGNNG